jgi:two-component system response regulator HupR/HoxA
MLSRIAFNEGKRFAGVSQKLMALLLNYSYPGNLRELNNILRAMVALGHNGEMLDVHLIPEKLFQTKTGDTLDDMIQENLQKNSFDFKELSDQMDRKVIQSILDRHQGNVKKAADQMNISEFGLRKKMSRLGISARKS